MNIALLVCATSCVVCCCTALLWILTVIPNGTAINVAAVSLGFRKPDSLQNQQDKARAPQISSSKEHQIPSVVKLNVGGVRYEVGRATLQKAEGMLGRMFEGGFVPGALDDEGRFFLDMDGKAFEYVLLYLRDGLLLQPIDPEMSQRVSASFAYLGLELHSEVSKYELALTGVPGLASMRQQEASIRRDLASSHGARYSLHEGLVAVFQAPEALCRYTPLPANLPQLFTATLQRPALGTLMRVSDIYDFKARWACMTHGQLDRVSWSNMVVAGGSVLGCLMARPPEEQPWSYKLYPGWSVLKANDEILPRENDRQMSGEPERKLWTDDVMRPTAFNGSDIDIFLYGLTEEEACDKLRQIHASIVSEGPAPLIVRTDSTVTFVCDFPRRHIQVVLRLYKSPAEVLYGFDVDCCCFAFDGEIVWGTVRGVRALASGFNLADPERLSPSYEFRLYKYAKRGFTVAVPGLEWAKLDRRLYHAKSAKEVEGLARLLYFEARLAQGGEPLYKKLARSGQQLLHNWFCQLATVGKALNRDDRMAMEMEEDAKGKTGSGSHYTSMFIPYGPRWEPSYVQKLFSARESGILHHTPADIPFIISQSLDEIMLGTEEDLRRVKTLRDELRWVVANPGAQTNGSFTPLGEQWLRGERLWLQHAYRFEVQGVQLA